MADDKEREGTELVVAEYHRKIKEAFEVFDHEANNTVDPSDAGSRVLKLTEPQDGGSWAPGMSLWSKAILRSGRLILDLKEATSPVFTWTDHIARWLLVRWREIGTIIRSLGCCPSEGELHDLIAEVEEEEPTGYIRYEKFLPVMTEVLLERRYRPIPEDTLLRAFEVLDPSKRGFLTREELIKYMTEEDHHSAVSITL
ncbi:dynein regulatory complex protein 8 isoform X3 [Mustela nigripes]|uniref:dynein regulatory complex protein 8 isoform X3 n=1 Tax=Mustela nigripes TaxID=77151 RepID=UPI002814EF71|nr:dynein regulatory complex protein 8 isoform X3 [Mustela nigripes]